jgi:hypothetical protein
MYLTNTERPLFYTQPTRDKSIFNTTKYKQQKKKYLKKKKKKKKKHIKRNNKKIGVKP